MSIRNPYVSDKTGTPTKTSRWDRLTPRERQVAALICQENGGKSYTNPQIATHLGISRETVKIHVRNILYKFKVLPQIHVRQPLSGWDLWQYQ